MKVKVFSVYDRLAEAFLPPFVSQTAATAVRQFDNSVNDPQHNFHTHSADYDLYMLGTFDDQVGDFENDKVQLDNGAHLKREETMTPDDAVRTMEGMSKAG